MTPVDWTIVGTILAGGAGIAGYLVWRLRQPSPRGPGGVVPSEAYRARNIVWLELWGLPADMLPDIHPVPPQLITCGHDGRGYLSRGRCVAGESYPPGKPGTPALCIVAFPTGVDPSGTALVHELRHARRWFEDPASLGEAEETAHSSPGFETDINAATATLVARRL